LNLYPLLLREMDAVKTDILTINKPHWVGGMAGSVWHNNGVFTGIISMKNQSFGNSTPCLGSVHTWVTVQTLGVPR
jgi:hypothetical protein